MDIKQISAAVETVLNKVLPEMDGHEEGDILLEWMLVAFVDNPESERGAAYPVLFSNGYIPKYRAMGLLEMARHELDSGNLDQDDDED